MTRPGTGVRREESREPSTKLTKQSTKLTKQEKREARRHAARRRRLRTRLRRAGIAAALLGVVGLLGFECSGAEELIDAEVIDTHLWRHFDQGTSHPHTAATLLIEGLSEAGIDRADGYRRGQRVPVWIRRGRISSWPYFRDVATPEEIERHDDLRAGKADS